MAKPKKQPKLIKYFANSGNWKPNNEGSEKEQIRETKRRNKALGRKNIRITFKELENVIKNHLDKQSPIRLTFKENHAKLKTSKPLFFEDPVPPEILKAYNSALIRRRWLPFTAWFLAGSSGITLACLPELIPTLTPYQSDLLIGFGAALAIIFLGIALSYLIRGSLNTHARNQYLDYLKISYTQNILKSQKNMIFFRERNKEITDDDIIRKSIQASASTSCRS